MKTLWIVGLVMATAGLLSANQTVMVDNGATRPYTDAAVTTAVATEQSARIAADLAGSNGVPGTVGGILSTGTVNNANNLGNVPASGYVTNLAGGYFDANKTVYFVSTYSLGTITVSRAWGDSIAIALTNNAAITFNPAEWPTNSMGCIGVSLHPNGYSTTFDPSMISTNSATNTIPGSAGLAIQTNTWNLLTFAKGWGWTVFGVHDR